MPDASIRQTVRFDLHTPKSCRSHQSIQALNGVVELFAVWKKDSSNVTLERTADGKAKATVTPEGSPTSFFLRVKVK